ALEVEPYLPQLHNNLGSALARSGNAAEAAAHFQRAIEINPNFAEAHSNLAVALAGNAQWARAIEHHREAIRLQPDAPHSRVQLAWLLATAPDDKLRNGAEAVVLAKQSCESVKDPDASQLDTL